MCSVLAFAAFPTDRIVFSIEPPALRRINDLDGDHIDPAIRELCPPPSIIHPVRAVRDLSR